MVRRADNLLARAGHLRQRLPRSLFAGATQRGQALVLTIVVLLVLCLGLFMLFDTGQVVAKKTQLVNAADAAAYSVAVEQARALNTVAYLNRAEVANQVAIAQIVSWQSYGNYTDSMAGRLSKALEIISVPLDFIGVGEVLTAAAETLQSMQEGLASGLAVTDKLGTAAVNVLNGLNAAYSTAQQGIVAAYGGQTMLSTVGDVVKANTLDADGQSTATIPASGEALLIAQLAAFANLPGADRIPVVSGNKGYTTRYQIPRPRGSGITGVQRSWAGDRDANVMMQARDGFSARRSANVLFGTVTKSGSTDLVDYDRWVAVDTLNFKFTLGICPACDKFDVPFAFGAAAALPSGNYSSRSVISPGIRLTKGSGDGPSDYRAGHGYGWDSPYDGHSVKPYDGALGNIGSLEVANDPTDRVFTSTTPQEVAWMPEYLPVQEDGLQDYDDVDPNKAVEPYQASAEDRGDVGPVFTVFVQQPTSTVRTGSTLGMEGGDLKLKDQGVDSAISAVSSAQVYFSRPRELFARDDGKRELGSLFEPYWQVRLVDTPTDYKIYLGLMAGL
jgi:hypothetical protein